MERMMTGDGRVRTFAECRNRRNRRTLLRVSVVLGVLLAAILALLFCLGRFAARSSRKPRSSPRIRRLMVLLRLLRLRSSPPDTSIRRGTRSSRGIPSSPATLPSRRGRASSTR